MEKLFARPLIYLDTYLASEGFLAYQDRPNEDMAMTLSYDTGIYFEFIPFEEAYFDEEGDPLPDAPVLSLSEIAENKVYALLISSVAGAWRYSIGDTVRITSKSRNELVISGRTKHFLNVAGSQLSVNKLNQAVQQLEEKFNTSIPEFTVSAQKLNGSFVHKWYLGVEDPFQYPAEEVSQELDTLLKNSFESYKEARNNSLKRLEVKIVPKRFFIQWAENLKKKGGQMKISRMMQEDLFEEWENFVSEKFSS